MRRPAIDPTSSVPASPPAANQGSGPTEVSSFAAKVLVVDDEESLRHMLALMLRREGYHVAVAANADEALELMQIEPADLVLCDVRMPGIDGLRFTELASKRWPGSTLVVMSAFGDAAQAIEAIRRGAYDYIAKPFAQEDVVLTLRKAQERERLRRENRRLRQRLQSDERNAALPGMLVASQGMQDVAATLRRVAPFKTTVLVLGESGVGKELLCRAIHELSPRAKASFVAINCGAIPENLIESELFGHIKGAFTDAARDHAGLFEEADGGTLLLDEVGELPLQVQVKLLRAIQEGEVRRVGDTRSRPVDVRLLAATSRPLEDMMHDGSFRSDLFYRLSVMRIEVPPLRERPDDIPALVDLFLEQLGERLGIALEGLTDVARERVLSYPWPGNVRELENTLERAAVLSRGGWIDEADLGLPLSRHGDPGGESLEIRLPPGDLSVKRAQRELERELILRALERTQGNRTHAARLLDLSHRALLYKLKSYAIGS